MIQFLLDLINLILSFLLSNNLNKEISTKDLGLKLISGNRITAISCRPQLKVAKRRLKEETLEEGASLVVSIKLVICSASSYLT